MNILVIPSPRVIDVLTRNISTPGWNRRWSRKNARIGIGGVERIYIARIRGRRTTPGDP
jgi:hypothetical protein